MEAALTKAKRVSSSRNDYTGKAVDCLNQLQVNELLHDQSFYLSQDERYLERRFHEDEYLTKLKVRNQQLSNEIAASETYLDDQEGHDIMAQNRFDRFLGTHTGDKPLLILDVDNTMLFSRFFSDEMRIGDVVTYFEDEFVSRDNAKVLKLQLKLHVNITDSALIDALGTEHSEIPIWIDNNDEFKRYTKGRDYHFQDEIPCKISKTEVIGCVIEVYKRKKPRHSTKQIEISFVDENEHLGRLEPCMTRAGMCPVDFIYEGFLIRLRPNLDEFLEYAAEDFDVVVYTAARKEIYNGLLHVLSLYLNEQLGRDEDDPIQLWSDVLYRDDCVLKAEAGQKPYHHKDITLFGCHLSRTVMVDNSPIAVCGQEPNIILIKDFMGKNSLDDELLEVYSMLDLIKDIPGDIRYFLCNIQDKQDQQPVDLSTEESCRQITQRFIQSFKADRSYHKPAISASNHSAEYSFAGTETYSMQTPQLSPIAPPAGSPSLPSMVGPNDGHIQQQGTMTSMTSTIATMNGMNGMNPQNSPSPPNPNIDDVDPNGQRPPVQLKSAKSAPLWEMKREQTKEKLRVKWHKRQSKHKPSRSVFGPQDRSLLNTPRFLARSRPKSPSGGSQKGHYKAMSTRFEDDENWDVVLPGTWTSDTEEMEEVEEHHLHFGGTLGSMNGSMNTNYLNGSWNPFIDGGTEAETVMSINLANLALADNASGQSTGSKVSNKAQPGSLKKRVSFADYPSGQSMIIKSPFSTTSTVTQQSGLSSGYPSTGSIAGSMPKNVRFIPDSPLSQGDELTSQPTDSMEAGVVGSIGKIGMVNDATTGGVLPTFEDTHSHTDQDDLLTKPERRRSASMQRVKTNSINEEDEGVDRATTPKGKCCLFCF